MHDRRYVEGSVTVTDGEQWQVVNVAADGQPAILAWACTDGHFYPLGAGPESPAADRHLFGVSVADLARPR